MIYAVRAARGTMIMASTFKEQFGAETQQVLTAILDQSQDCIKLLSPAGELEFMNRNGQKAMEIPDFGMVAGKKWTELWPAESRKLIEGSLDKAGRGQQSRFEALCPTMSGKPSWWDVSVAPVYDDKGAITHVLATSRDVSGYVSRRLSDQMRREEAEREVDFAEAVAREMRHRLKNQLAVIGSVAKLLARHSETAAELSEKFERKISALGRAQDLLTVHRDEPISAAEAMVQVLEASGAGEAIELLPVPDARLGDDAVQQLALILGELQTNSLKYGALSAACDGKVTLSSTLLEGLLSIHWHEDCGTPVEAPQKTGSGAKLIERLGSARSSRAMIDWHRTGPSVTFHLSTLA